MVEAERFFESLPGGFTRITGGGTRNQLKLLPDSLDIPEGVRCPFETDRKEEGMNIPGIPDGWRVLNNRYTPHLMHRLVIPPTCWPKDQLQNLGGEEALTKALRALALTVADYGVETACFTHIGRAGGQNVQHNHWHAMQVLVERPLKSGDFADAIKSDRIISENEGFITFAGGARAGEYLIVPFYEISFRESVRELGSAILHVVGRGNEKFSNPAFMVTIRVSADGMVRYADYCPVLNFWGATETVIAMLEGSPMTLPFTHELSAEILRG